MFGRAKKEDDRFEEIYIQSDIMGTTEIWVDKITGVNYLYHARKHGAGLTPLLDKDGKPVVSELE